MDADSSIINLMGNRVLGKLIIIQLIKKSLKFYNISHNSKFIFQVFGQEHKFKAPEYVIFPPHCYFFSHDIFSFREQS